MIWDEEDDPEGPSADDMERFGDEWRTCPACGERIYDQAEICPHCGEAQEAEPKRAPWWLPIVVIIVLGALLAAVLL